MKEYFVEGTLGDAFTVVCKLWKVRDQKIKIFHYTVHKHWYNEIIEIYSLLPKAEV